MAYMECLGSLYFAYLACRFEQVDGCRWTGDRNVGDICWATWTGGWTVVTITPSVYLCLRLRSLPLPFPLPLSLSPLSVSPSLFIQGLR